MKKAKKSRSQIETKKNRKGSRSVSGSNRKRVAVDTTRRQLAAAQTAEAVPAATEGLASPAKIVDASKKEALDLSAEVQEGVNALERKWWHIGRLVDVCLKRHVPRALGLTAKQWMEKYLEGSLSDAFRKMRVIRGLAGVPEEKIDAMKQANAQQLCRLPEAERKSEEWVELAASVPVGEFKEKVDKRLEERGVPMELFGEFYFKGPLSVIEQLEAAEKKVALMLSLNTFLDGWRIQTWEAIASMLNNTAVEALQIEMVGADK